MVLYINTLTWLNIFFYCSFTLAYLSGYRILSSKRFFLKTGRHQSNVFYHPCCRREISWSDSFVSGTNQFVFLLEVFNVLSLFLELKILCRTVGPLSFILIGTCWPFHFEELCLTLVQGNFLLFIWIFPPSHCLCSLFLGFLLTSFPPLCHFGMYFRRFLQYYFTVWLLNILTSKNSFLFSVFFVPISLFLFHGCHVFFNILQGTNDHKQTNKQTTPSPTCFCYYLFHLGSSFSFVQ